MLGKPRVSSREPPTVEECLKQAEKAAAKIPSVFWRVSTHTRLAEVWARLQNLQNARAHLQQALEASLSEPPAEREARQVFRIAEVAKTFEEEARWKQILALAFETVEAAPEDFLTINLVVRSLVEWNLLEEALRASRILSDERAKDKATLLCTLAGAYFQRGEAEQAESLLQEAVEYLGVLPWDDDEIRVALAQAWAAGGRWKQAVLWAGLIEEPDYRAEAWCALAQAYHQVGNTEGAAKALINARNHALEAENVWLCAQTLAQVARAYALIGLTEQAETLFAESLAICETEPDPEQRDRTLDQIAEYALEARLPQISYQACLKNQNPVYRTFNIIDVLSCLAPDYDADMYAEALRSAKRVDGASGRAEALAKIGRQLAWAGQFQQAWDIVRLLPHAYWRGVGLLGYARACAHHQRWDLAMKALHEIERMHIPDLTANAYLNFAEEILEAKDSDSRPLEPNE